MNYSSYLACPKCGDRFHLHAEDIKNGYQIKKVILEAHKPKDLHIEVASGGSFDNMKTHTIIPIDVMVCDLCNDAIYDGSPAVAITMWRGKEPDPWWLEYGKAKYEH